MREEQKPSAAFPTMLRTAGTLGGSALTSHAARGSLLSREGGRGIRFAGYAALFDRVDRGGDVVRRGAFARAVKGASVPLLMEHRPGSPVGRVEMLGEDRRGLRVIARVDRGAVREGMGLSFGYRVRSARGPSTGSGQVGPRELLDVELVEVSLVAVPMQPGARVHRVVLG